MVKTLPVQQTQENSNQETANIHYRDNSHSLLAMSKALDAMMQKDFDLDKFERVTVLRDKEIDRQNKKIFYEALSVAQNQIGAIEKDQANNFLKTHYSSLNKTLEKAKPILARYGFSFITEIENQTDNRITLKATLLHECGEISQSANFPLDGGGKDGRTNKNLIQAIGSTITYGRRYLFNMLLNISSTDEDSDGHIENITHPCTREQREEIIKLIEKTHTDVTKLLAHSGLQNLNDLTCDQAENLKGLLKNKQKRMMQEAAPKINSIAEESINIDSNEIYEEVRENPDGAA